MRVALLLTVLGPIIGRISDDQTDEVIEEAGYITLERPMRISTIPLPTPQGVQNIKMMAPVLEDAAPGSDDTLVLMVGQHVLLVNNPEPNLEKAYLERTSSIALVQPPAGRIQVAK